VPAFDLFFQLVDEFRGVRADYRFGRAVELWGSDSGFRWLSHCRGDSFGQAAI
jgi:hypothetical protein